MPRDSSDLATSWQVTSTVTALPGGGGDAAAQLIAGGDAVLFVGTDADEWWNNSVAAKGALRRQLEATGGFDIEGPTISRSCVPVGRSFRCG